MFLKIMIIVVFHLITFNNLVEVHAGKALTPLGLDKKVACIAEHLKVHIKLPILVYFTVSNCRMAHLYLHAFSNITG